MDYCVVDECHNPLPCHEHPEGAAPRLTTRVVVVFGPPGSGKGTQCKLLANKYGFVHLSTGDMFRDAVKNGTALGRVAGPQLAKSDFVEDQVVIKLVLDSLEQHVKANGVLLDGFPRTQAQAQALCQAVNVEGFFLLMASDDVCVERITKRRIDAQGNIFNLASAPPPMNLPVKPREDDENISKIRARLRGYHKVLAGVLPFFNGRLHVVDGLGSPEAVREQIERQGLLTQTSERDIARKEAILEAAKPNICAACRSQTATWLILPCNHLCCCASCVEQQGVCPKCKRVVEARIQMTISAEAVEVKEGKDEGGWDEDAPEEAAEEEAVVSLSCNPCQPVTPSGLVDVAISIRVQKAKGRIPIDLCCVVDVSGSMRNLATYEEDGEMKHDGLSVLDVVKHACRAVIRLLTPEDRFSLVSFDTHAVLQFPLKHMTDQGKGEAEAALAELTPKGSTNLWAGLRTGMESLRSAVASKSGAKSSVMLLTDGVPNSPPELGYEGELQKYLEINPGFSFQLSTFGFGSKLNSTLLLALARLGNGIFAFIPDAKIVGTCFVNSVANAACSRTQTAMLHLKLKNGATFTGPVRGDLSVTDTQWAKVVALGSLQHGQSREVVVPLQLGPGAGAYLEAYLVYPADGGGEHKVSLVCSDRSPSVGALVALARAEMVTTAGRALADYKNGELACGYLADLNTRMAGWLAECPEGAPSLERLSADTNGRLSKAFSTRERAERWGRHYAAALMRAHQLQLCTNFMDPGLQLYKGENFLELSEQGGKIFVSLPAPVPQKVIYPSLFSSNSTSARPSSPPPMQNYYAGEGGGCFAGQCTVLKLREDGVAVPMRVRDVRSRDILAVSGGFARVRFVAEIACRSPLVALEGGLLLTPSHPVRVGGLWQRPKHLSSQRVENPEKVVYNFVMESSHIVLVNDVECATWGHGFTDPAVAHEFYGSMAKVMNALEKLSSRNGVFYVHQSLRAEN